MATHTSSSKARRARDRDRNEMLAAYSRNLIAAFGTAKPEFNTDFNGKRAAQHDREGRIALYESRAMLGLPLFVPTAEHVAPAAHFSDRVDSVS